jgi:23S rRNA pseudouridine1911/1915/1917 synthase
VVIKPTNLPCCPDETGDDNLLDKLKRYVAANRNSDADETKPALGGNAFVGIVHRLDRVTGGVMVYAKTSKAAARLSIQIQETGEFKKTYLAVVNGAPKEREGTLVNHLLKNENRNTVEIVPSATNGAKRAELVYRIANKSPKSEAGKRPPNICLVEVDLITGRGHQIRVQLSHIGCPIFGDAKYGGDKLGKGWGIALWAHRLSFRHPISNDVMKFIVNPPETVPWTSFDFDRKSHKHRGEPAQ